MGQQKPVTLFEISIGPNRKTKKRQKYRVMDQEPSFFTLQKKEQLKFLSREERLVKRFIAKYLDL